MSTTGPLGALPPDEWAVGARVLFEGLNLDGGVVFESSPLGLVVVGRSRNAPHDVCTETVTRARCRLDLAVGCLGAGTRALWHLLGCGEQPPTPPDWSHLGGIGWLLRSAAQPSTVVPGAGAETDRRHALALALVAARRMQ